MKIQNFKISQFNQSPLRSLKTSSHQQVIPGFDGLLFLLQQLSSIKPRPAFGEGCRGRPLPGVLHSEKKSKERQAENLSVKNRQIKEKRVKNVKF
jgi:hypothetical protein